MKSIGLLLILLMSMGQIQGQDKGWQNYEPSHSFPFGKLNPDAPEQLKDFAPMIGTCDCQSLRRNPDGTWADTSEMIWTFKYILNGTAIQDLTWSEGMYATSIRQFQADSLLWVVGYNSFPGVSTTSSSWLGAKVGDEIVLKQSQKAPNGMEGVSRLTFLNINANGFDWKGEWVNEEMGIVYPFWQIWCIKRKR